MTKKELLKTLLDEVRASINMFRNVKIYGKMAWINLYQSAGPEYCTALFLTLPSTRKVATLISPQESQEQISLCKALVSAVTKKEENEPQKGGRFLLLRKRWSMGVGQQYVVRAQSLPGFSWPLIFFLFEEKDLTIWVLQEKSGRDWSQTLDH